MKHLGSDYVKGYEYVTKVLKALNGQHISYSLLWRRVHGSHSTLQRVLEYLKRRKLIYEWHNNKFPFQSRIGLMEKQGKVKEKK